MEVAVHKLTRERLADFYQIHRPENGEGWCNCVAWWVPSWDGWGDRTAEGNRKLRDNLFDDGHYDGYLLYVDGSPVAWCQRGPRDRLQKLRRQYDLPEDDSIWAVTCFVVIPAFRGKGLTHLLLKEVLADLKRNGIKRVQAFPKCGAGLEPGAVWTGPESVFVNAGFKVERDHPEHPIYEWCT